MKIQITATGLFLIVLLFSSCSSQKRANRETRILKKKTEERSNKISKAEKENENLLKEKYARYLNVKPDEIKNLKLYRLIDEWYGVPYRYGGKDKNGIDCSGFIDIILSNIYDKNPAGTCMNYYEKCKIIEQEALKEGDLLFFKIEEGKVSHIGLYLTNNKFIHATKKIGVMINDLNEPYYKKYFFEAGRLK